MLQAIEGEHIVATIKSFCEVNEGDENTQSLLVAVGAEILDVSEDRFQELMSEPYANF